MRDYQKEFEGRVAWIRALVESAHASGIVFGNSGGKDSALVGILCKAACGNTVGVLLPCGSARSYGADADDGRALAEAYGIETRRVDLGQTREKLIESLGEAASLNDTALINLAPRLRMTALYAIGATSPNGATGPATSTRSPISRRERCSSSSNISGLRAGSSTRRLRPGSSTARPTSRTWA